METVEVVEKDEYGNEVVGRSKGQKSLLGFVLCLKLLVEALNKVIGNIIAETFHTDVPDSVQRLDGHSVSKVSAFTLRRRQISCVSSSSDIASSFVWHSSRYVCTQLETAVLDTPYSAVRIVREFGHFEYVAEQPSCMFLG